MGDAHRLLIAMLLGSLVATVRWAAAAEDELLARAQRLVEQQKGAEAYALLQPQAEARAGDPAFDYVFGVAALDAGKLVEAAFALERVLDVQPDNALARAELGRTYYEMGENDAARKEFERVKGQQIPPDFQLTLDRYLSAIDARFEKSRTRYQVYIETGVGYDSNVNSATDARNVVLPALGSLTFNLDANAQEQDSAIWTINAGVTFTSPLDRGFSLFGGIDLNHRAALEDTTCRTAKGDTTCSTQSATGSLGVQYEQGRNKYRLSGQAQRFYVGSDENQDYAGGNAQWIHTLGNRDQVSAFAQGAAIRFPGQEIRDVNRFTGGLGWGHIFAARGTPVLFASIFGGTERETEDNARGVGRNLAGARLGGEVSVNKRTKAFATFDYQGSWYDSPTPGFVKDREDDYFRAGAGMRYAITRLISVRPEVSYTVNDSNTAIVDYDRWQAMLTFSSDF